MLEALPPGSSVVIDMKRVEVFDFSFAAEFFGRLLQRLPTEFPGRFLVAENLGAWTRPNLEAALAGLDLAMVARSGGNHELLGKVAETDRVTFDALLRSGGPATAPELAHDLGVNLTAMNERLAKLVRAGLIRRQEAAGRARFVYLPPA
jgi:hypothetical protein